MLRLFACRAFTQSTCLDAISSFLMFLHLPTCLSHINSLLPWRHSKLTGLILAHNLAAQTWPTAFLAGLFAEMLQLSHVVQFVERRSGQTMETLGSPSPSRTTNTEQYPRPGPWVATDVSRTRVFVVVVVSVSEFL